MTGVEDLYARVLMAWGRVCYGVRPLATEDLDVAALPGWGGGRVVLAREHKQGGGSFRARGALSAVRVLRYEGALTSAGIAVAAETEASAAAWAWAASIEDVPATVFVPPLPPPALERLGKGVVVRDGDRVERCEAYALATGALRPDGGELAAGACTWVLDLHARTGDVATVLIPVPLVDEDGLLLGTIIAAYEHGIKVVLVAMAGAPIPDAVREVLSGGWFPGIPRDRPRVRLELVTVTVAELRTAAEMLRWRGRIVTEEGALPLAALMTTCQEPRRCYRPGRGEPVAVLLAGPPSEADRPDRANPFRLQPHSLGRTGT
ncbi:pyridoxal-phosphate dependent enzyme [Nocardia jiangxiensis]|uniref:pyridoxal-phosphate dependent enzyme n=1 Tax=Nocardia jiangxiensis TaxID=282685 RepID=UPI0002D2CA08|nr:pyridoxal-phosphate dependent enzyme [Nocardia jiangxiensis]